MEEWRKEVDTLYRLLDQEVSHYRQLIGEVKEEARCLRSGDPEALIRSVRVIEDWTHKIRNLEEEVRKRAQKLLGSLGKGGVDHPLSSLLPLLPPPHRSRLSSYQKEIDHLKTWLKQINERNVIYIRDCLDLLSSLIRPMVEGDGASSRYPGYRPLRATAPMALNQEV
ncbi:MAG: flagellar protein FlgN [Desulfobacterota bacterium]|nr:flagellar protein FlgN [Thermodesulfobacteriota bacterium]